MCSGIECATLGWKHLGWEPVAFSEIEPFQSQLLRTYYPDVPNLGDMSRINGKDFEGKVDVLVGGTPCQSYSIMGKRGSLNDPRGQLSLIFSELIHEINPRVVVWENVPGCLFAKGNPFGHILAGFIGSKHPVESGRPKGTWPRCGMVVGPKRSAAWRVLNSQYFGVPQRRNRVYLVSFRTGDRINPGAVLFEPQVLSGSVETPRGAQTEPPCSRSSHDRIEKAIAFGKQYGITLADSGDVTPPLTVTNNPFVYVLATANRGANGLNISKDTSYTLGTDCAVGIMENQSNRIRKLTPLECERLQGLPDNYTGIEFKGRIASDTQRYKAIGNGMAVPCIKWVGERIQKVSEDANMV